MAKFCFRNSGQKKMSSQSSAIPLLRGMWKFHFRNSTLRVMSWQSSAPTTPFRSECLAKFHFCNHAVEGSVFTKFPFRNSALDVIWQSSASATPLRRESLQEIPQFRCYGECLHKVPLPQLCSEGNIFSKFRFHNSVHSERMSS